MEKRAALGEPSLGAMTIKLSHAFVWCLDQDEALRFYTDALGFEVRTDAPMEHMRWLTVGPPDQPDVEVGLLEPVPGASAEDSEAVRRLVAKGVLGSLLFRTDDVRAAFERVKATGAEILQEPTEMPYGVIDCAFRDPSGNHVRLGQELDPA
jgi:catechol 2,3-dioxygenase-like lactoylglutathione lyase family enzyme